MLELFISLRSDRGWKDYLLIIFKCFNVSNFEFFFLFRIFFIVLKILGFIKMKNLEFRIKIVRIEIINVLFLVYFKLKY